MVVFMFFGCLSLLESMEKVETRHGGLVILPVRAAAVKEGRAGRGLFSGESRIDDEFPRVGGVPAIRSRWWKPLRRVRPAGGIKEDAGNEAAKREVAVVGSGSLPRPRGRWQGRTRFRPRKVVEHEVCKVEGIEDRRFYLREGGEIFLAGTIGTLILLVGGFLITWCFFCSAAGQADRGVLPVNIVRHEVADGAAADEVGHQEGQQHG